MSKVLIFYATEEGQTAKIARFIAGVGRGAGHEVDVRDVAAKEGPADLGPYTAVIVGSPVYYGRHPRRIVRWIREHRAPLAQKGACFFQVCMTSAKDDAEHAAQAAAVIDRMKQETGWPPARAVSFAGTIAYTRYPWWKKLIMKRIARGEGGPTDTSRDHEHTDWARVRIWAEERFAALGGPVEHERARV
jgi:menaquinone-dependent protoporphyrinogen oxidase